MFRNLFKELKWLNGKAFSSARTQQQAILLLNYVAQGALDTVSEEDLTIGKILMGWPLTTPIDLQLPISESAKAAVELLLHDFIHRWMVGKKFSNNWIRQRFLQRTGRLYQSPDGGWQLILEQKSEDILLNKLPTGIGFSLIRYTWMDSLLHVKWDYNL